MKVVNIKQGALYVCWIRGKSVVCSVDCISQGSRGPVAVVLDAQGNKFFVKTKDVLKEVAKS